MDDQNTDSQQHESGVASWIAAVLIVALMASGAGNVYQAYNRSEQPTPNKDIIALQKAQAEAGKAIQDRLQVIQLDVIKRCADRGNIPVFNNQNGVDCKTQPK